MRRDATVTRMIVVEYGGRLGGYGSAIARSRKPSVSVWIADEVNLRG